MTIPTPTAGQTISSTTWGAAVAEQLNDLPTKIQSGNTAVTTNGSGQATITFPDAFGATPIAPSAVVNGSSLYNVYVTGVTATTMTVTIRSATSGSIMTSLGVNVMWVALGTPA